MRTEERLTNIVYEYYERVRRFERKSNLTFV
jgi:hypothetical protein